MSFGIDRDSAIGRAPLTDDWKPAKMEPRQFELRTRSYAPFRQFGGCFEGDNRGRTARLDVTSRITQKTVVDTRGWNELSGIRVTTNSAYSDRSRHPVLGEETQQPRGDASFWNRGDETLIRQHLEASNPLVPGSPDIDLDTEITVDFAGVRDPKTNKMMSVDEWNARMKAGE